MPTYPGDQASPEQPSTSVSLLDDELMSLGEEKARPREGGGSAVREGGKGNARSTRATYRAQHVPLPVSTVECGGELEAHFTAEEAEAQKPGACARSHRDLISRQHPGSKGKPRDFLAGG